MQQFLANSMRMEDDTDALLDDVEAKYCEQMCQRASAPTAGTSSDDSIEEAINEICRVPELNVPNRDLTESKLFGRRNIQCYVVYLGGTDVVFGVSTSASKRACSHIHCRKCDFQVSVFEDFAWDETADYLFFRNSVPDANKLRSRLFRKLGGVCHDVEGAHMGAEHHVLAFTPAHSAVCCAATLDHTTSSRIADKQESQYEHPPTS